jgi:hypothetical protein
MIFPISSIDVDKTFKFFDSANISIIFSLKSVPFVIMFVVNLLSAARKNSSKPFRDNGSPPDKVK